MIDGIWVTLIGGTKPIMDKDYIEAFSFNLIKRIWHKIKIDQVY